MKNSAAPASGAMIDRFGRVITYLRVSLTDGCNMKCGYCFDSIENHSAPTRELDNDQLLRAIEAFAILGVNKVRFTGGEPLLRHGLVDLIARTTALAGIQTVGITTNGLLLERHLSALIGAGLNRLNISLDTLNLEKFRAITGIDGLKQVMAGIQAAISSKAFARVKLNTVVMRGINDRELAALAAWALDLGADIRFIEFMPTARSGWSHEKYVSEAEMRSLIGLDLQPVTDCDSSPGPASTYRYRDCPGRVSFISAVSHSFCETCNRLRLTSRGEVVGCLFQSDKFDLLPIMQKDSAIEDIAQIILKAMPNFRREPDEVSITDYMPLMKAVGG